MRISRASIVAAALGCTLLPGSTQGQAPEPDLSAVAFMVGCWAEDAPEGSGLREVFAAPARNLMTGLSQFWNEGSIVEFEFHVISASDEGPVLKPHPGGVGSVEFQPRAVAANRIEWENLTHDFPQRIIYHRIGKDTLTVRVEGGEGGSLRSTTWEMMRTSCANGDQD